MQSEVCAKSTAWICWINNLIFGVERRKVQLCLIAPREENELSKLCSLRLLGFICQPMGGWVRPVTSASAAHGVAKLGSNGTLGPIFSRLTLISTQWEFIMGRSHFTTTIISTSVCIFFFKICVYFVPLRNVGFKIPIVQL